MNREGGLCFNSQRIKLSCEHIPPGEFAFDSMCIRGEVLTFWGSRRTEST